MSMTVASDFAFAGAGARRSQPARPEALRRPGNGGSVPWFAAHPRVATVLAAPPYDHRVVIESVHAYYAQFALGAVVCVPVRNEAALLPACLGALKRAIGRLSGDSCGVIFIVNNTADELADILREWAAGAGIAALVCEVTLLGSAANVAIARRLAFDIAEGVARRDAVILSTDADTRVGADWVVRLVAAVRGGAAMVAGGIEADEAELAGLPAKVHHVGAVERTLGDLYRQIWAQLVPGEACPMMQTAGGASMAISSAAYRAVGRLPTDARNEDRALAEAVLKAGAPFAEEPAASAVTSCRLDARASHGMADTLVARCHDADPDVDGRLTDVVTFILHALAWQLVGNPPAGAENAACEVAQRLGVQAGMLECGPSPSRWARMAAIIEAGPPRRPLSVSAARVEIARARGLLSALPKGNGEPFGARVAAILKELDDTRS